MDAQKILWPISEAIDNLSDCRDKILELAFEKFRSGDDQEASRVRDIVKQIEKIADDLEPDKDDFVKRLDLVLEKLRQEHDIQEISITSQKRRGKSKSSSTARSSLDVHELIRTRKVLILGSEEKQPDTLLDLHHTGGDELETEFWGIPIKGVSLMLFEEAGEYSLQQSINIRAIAEAEMGGSIDDDKIIEIEEDCMSAIFTDAKFRLDIDEVIVEMSCYRYLSGNDVEEIKKYFLNREELQEARENILALARRVTG